MKENTSSDPQEAGRQAMPGEQVASGSPPPIQQAAGSQGPAIKPPNPYVGPRTFDTKEREFFFGRDREAQDLLQVVLTERVSLFYAQSGAGKSSLINTSLIPGLIEEEYQILPVGRLQGETVDKSGIRNIFVYNLITSLIQNKIDEPVLADLSLSRFLAGLDYEQGQGYFYNENVVQEPPGEDSEEHVKSVLIVDQFEELFTTHQEQWKRREDFFRQLSQALEDFPNLSVVLALREEFLAALDPYAYIMPGKLRARYYMQRLGHRAAREAIERPAARQGRPIVPAVVERLVDDLSSIKVRMPDGALESQPGQYVEPVQLQVVCYGLWEKMDPGASQITMDLLEEKVGDVTTALGDYFAKRVAEIVQELNAQGKNVSEYEIRQWFESRLITSDGIRNMVAQVHGGRSAGLEDFIVQEFVRRGDLVREEKRGGATFYELTHDRLVEPILQNNREWFETNADLLQKRVSVWLQQERSPSLLLRGRDLRTARKLARNRSSSLTGEEKIFLNTSIRTETTRWFIIILTLVIVGLLVSLTAYAANQTNMAVSARDDANKQWITAQAAAAEAIKQKSIADNNYAKARANELEAERQRLVAGENQVNAEVQGSIAWAQIFQNAPGGLFKSTLLAMDAILRSKSLPSDHLDISAAEEILRENLTFLPRRVDMDEIQQDEGIDHMAFSADGGTLITAGSSVVHGQVCGWKLPEREQLFCRDFSPIQDLSFSLDGQLMAGDDAGHVLTLDPLTGEIQSDVDMASGGKIESLVIGPDGRKILIVGTDGKITVNDIKKPSVQGYYLDSSSASHTAVVFSPRGQRLAAGTIGGTLAFWGLSDGSYGSRKDHNGMVNVVRFSPDERYIITGGRDHYALVFDRMNGGLRRLPHSGSVSFVEVSPDGTWIATASEDRQIRVWDLKTGKEKVRMLQESPVTGLLISPRGQMIVTSGEDKYVHAWSAETGKEVLQIPTNTGSPVLGFNQADDDLYIGDSQGRVSVWDVSTLATPTRTMELTGMAENIQYLAKDRVAFADRRLVWELPADSFKELTALPKDQPAFQAMSTISTISHMAVSPDPEMRYLAVSTDDSTLEAVDTKGARTMLFRLGNSVKDMAFSSDGQELIALYTDGKVATWPTFSKPEFTDITPPERTIAAISVGPKFLAMGTDGEIWLVDPADPEKGNVVEAPGDHILLAFSSDGSLLADANSDGTINLWQPTDGSLGDPIRFNKPQALSLAFSPDGSRLAIGTASSVFLVDTKDGGEIARIPVADIVNDISISGDGRLLTVASSNLIQTWELESMQPIDDLVQAACQRLGRNLDEVQWKDVLSQENYDAIMATCGN